MQTFDTLIIGGGLIGTSTARALLKRRPGLKVALLEKENALAVHTSGRNSGVLHAGFNQKPGTLKARLCVDGNRRMRDYCRAAGLPLQENGILVVARDAREFSALEEIFKRGTANGVPGLAMMGERELAAREPNVIGIKAMWAPSGAGVDSNAIVQRLARDAKEDGAMIYPDQRVMAIEQTPDGYKIITQADTFACRTFINCAGLHADRVAHMVGAGLDYTIVPFRGEYFKVKEGLQGLVKAMVYPVPDLRFPFLGIHWTKTVHGDLKVGPNAILALGRESYRFWDIHWGDCLAMIAQTGVWRLLANPDFRRLFREQARTSLSRRAFLKEAAQLVKGVTPEDFVPGPAGIRAQLVDRKGRLVDDLLVEKKGSSLHVLNAISPGLTCSLAFAEYLCDLMIE